MQHNRDFVSKLFQQEQAEDADTIAQMKKRVDNLVEIVSHHLEVEQAADLTELLGAMKCLQQLESRQIYWSGVQHGGRMMQMVYEEVDTKASIP